VAGTTAGLAVLGPALALAAQLPTASPAETPAPASAGVPTASYFEAGIRPDQTPEPGDRIELDVADPPAANGPAAPAMTYRWVQTEGPHAEVQGDNQRKLRIQIPDARERLGFLRIGTAPGQVRIIHFTVPVAPGSSPASAAQPATTTPTASVPLHADAGDDQVGLVGHRVTLNGTRSAPAGSIVYRWMQVAGPAVVGPKTEGGFFSFVPSGPGLYQFALVVGGSMGISEPDPVAVLVGAAPAGAGLAPAGAPAETPAAGAPTASPTAPPTSSTQERVAAASAQLPDGRRIADEMADVFEAVAGRSSLYASFADLQSELARRLDVVVPAEEPARATWTREVLQPLTQLTVQDMLAKGGLDLRAPAGVMQPLSPAQQDQLKALLLQFSRTLRSTASARADTDAEPRR
jgi:hypothetical protein